MKDTEMTPAEQGIVAAQLDAQHEGTRRAYYHIGESWYAESSLQDREFVDEVEFGLYYPDGGCAGEMGMRWIPLGQHIAPQLQVFNDAWATLAQFTDLLEELAKVDAVDMSPQRFCQILEHCGFVDMTQREQEEGGEDE